MTTTFKNMTPDEKRMHIIKDITGALDESIVATRQAGLANMPILGPVLDKAGDDNTSGRVLQPYVDLAQAGQTNFVIKGLSIPRTIEVLEGILVDETIEDMNPTIGPRLTLTNQMGISMARDLEKKIVDAIKADGTIPTLPKKTDPGKWVDIIGAMVDMGTDIVNTAGDFVVILSLEDYLDLLTDEDYYRAQSLEQAKRVKIMPHDSLVKDEMIVFHEHGVAGLFAPRNLEFDRQGGSQATVLVGSYAYGYAWDTNYIRKIS